MEDNTYGEIMDFLSDNNFDIKNIIKAKHNKR